MPRASQPLTLLRAPCLLLALVGAPACAPSDSTQLAPIQAIADALLSRRPDRLKLACQQLVPEHHDPMSCDNLIVPLLHYAPAFAGSRVTRRGRTVGGWLGRPLKVPVHYQSPTGSGTLDVTMRHAEGNWRIYSILPIGKE